MPRTVDGSIEGPRSWQAATLAVVILAVGFGAPLLAVVGMRQIQADMGTDRSVIALASALVWIGNATGGVVMGRLAVAIGMSRTALVGTASIAAGLALSSLGSVWAIYVGHGLLIGFLGLGALYAPLTVYVSHWFDKRRGTALALIASGQYVAGMLWPSVIEQGIAHVGWRHMMLIYAAMVAAAVPLAFFLRPPPEHIQVARGVPAAVSSTALLRLPPNVLMAMLCFGGFFCCVPMALPASHLVAFCGDIGISPASGAAMLSVMLACAFVSRQGWGMVADRVGGLRTILAGSVAQIVTLASFLLTRNEVGLFVIAGAYGLGFSGLIPAYAVAIRDLFPAKDASWRIPTVLLFLMGGMAFGSWFGGWLYDIFLSYRVAFTVGVMFNAVNLVVILFLVSRLVAKQRASLVLAE
jgi:MFS family permease